MTIAKDQVSSDKITLLAVDPAANESACPGQNVTLNCSVTRTVSNKEIQQLRISWIYNNALTVNIIEPTNKNLQAEFIEQNYSVVSIVKIINVRLINNIEIRCESSKKSQNLRISAAGIS